jgi:hypothetical protein
LAEEQFLHQRDVAGIGLAGDSSNVIVFFLHQRSSEGEREIRDWAKRLHVRIELRVVGHFKQAAY